MDLCLRTDRRSSRGGAGGGETDGDVRARAGSGLICLSRRSGRLGGGEGEGEGYRSGICPHGVRTSVSVVDSLHSRSDSPVRI